MPDSDSVGGLEEMDSKCVDFCSILTTNWLFGMINTVVNSSVLLVSNDLIEILWKILGTPK